MKAICVLLCIALARDSAGNIFQQRRNKPEIRRYLSHSNENVDQYENEPVYQQNQYKNNQFREWSAEEHLAKQRKYDYPQYHQRNYKQPQSRFSEQAEHQYKQQKAIEHQYPYQEPVEYQYRFQEPVEHQYRFQEPVVHMYRYQKPAQQKYHKNNYHNTKTSHIYQPEDDNDSKYEQEISRYADAVSESKEIEDVVQRLNLPNADQHALPKFADMEAVSNVFTSNKNEESMYGDAVVWRGIQVAANPENHISEKDIQKFYIEAQKATKHIDRDTKTTFHRNVNVAINTENEDTHLNATQLLKKYQYPVEEHTIKTEDGYLLTLFRIPPKQVTNEDKQRPVVFLMHGLLSCADDWLLMGPHESLAYQLSDAGYDVWLGNARSSRYAHHVSKHRMNPDFWQFSNDEIALYDLPAMIDYVLQTSNQQKMVYIGHSLGTTAFFSLAAARPVYNNKIVVMYALAPMTYMSNVRSPLMRMIAPTSELYDSLNQQLGRGEFKPSKEVVRTLGGEMCQKEIECRHLCSNVYPVMTGVNVEHLNTSIIPLILSHLPAGASTRQIKQYGQSVASHDFRMYDFGAELNKKVYGETQPPKYDMTAVTAPVALYYSEDDWLSHPKDVQRLKEDLPNVTEEYKIPQEYFTHMDFQFSNQAHDVYVKLIESIQKNYPY
ncbi:unnamed protein product [Diatraea saccharalis]|uniref:Partial AB-hydrolase lipase domain-containing protein n=1 Tax=Diatraea saccharalis TaxID=40085 RepID=A0A9N9RF57_9NEOP|nr:unnamed protein product [Diatraea saccharalis]